MLRRYVTIFVSLVALLSISGCASVSNGITFSLHPNYIPHIFEKNSECGKLVSDAGREWLAAAGLFIKEEHRTFDSTKDLASYLKKKTNGKVLLAESAPIQVSTDAYLMELGEYGTMLLTITPTRIELLPSDKRVNAMLLHQYGLKSDRLQFDSSQNSNQSSTAAFLALFRAL